MFIRNFLKFNENWLAFVILLCQSGRDFNVLYRGRAVVLYRGMNNNLQCVQSHAKFTEIDSKFCVKPWRPQLQKSRSAQRPMTISPKNYKPQKGLVLIARYKDWSGWTVEVLSLMMLACVQDYKPPSRLLHYKITGPLREGNNRSA